MSERVLYLFGSAAPPVLDLPAVVERTQGDGWTVCVGLTPTAADWLGDAVDVLAESTGFPVRVRSRRPGETDVWPTADAAVVVPATLNSVNLFALGLTPHFVGGYVAEAIGKGWPLAVMPCVNAAYATHPRFERSIGVLREAGVRTVYGEGGFEPLPPGEGRPDRYPWHLALDAARELAG